MSVLWRHVANGTTYEVRAAGNSIRLYTDNVLHSQWNPHRPLTRSVWDCLSLPGFFLPHTQPARVLMLGVGGGACIRQIQQLFSPKQITGVELDLVHIEIAHRWFGIPPDHGPPPGGENQQATRIDLVHADATEWLRNYDGPRFHMVIDDLWGKVKGEACRVVPLEGAWAEHVLRVTHREGVVVANFESRAQFRRCSLRDSPRVRRRYMFEREHYGNVVGVFTTTMRTRRHWRQRINTCTTMSPEEKRISLSTRVSVGR